MRNSEMIFVKSIDTTIFICIKLAFSGVLVNIFMGILTNKICMYNLVTLQITGLTF